MNLFLTPNHYYFRCPSGINARAAALFTIYQLPFLQHKMWIINVRRRYDNNSARKNQIKVIQIANDEVNSV